MNNSQIKRDYFGAPIICRFCRAKGFDFGHNPSKCTRCYHCGDIGHDQKHCYLLTGQMPTNSNKKLKTKDSLSARRAILIDNISDLIPNEPVSIDVEKVEGVRGEFLPAWVVIYRNPKGRKYRNCQKIVYSAFIRQLNVAKFMTRWSGIVRLDCSEDAIPFDIVKKRVELALKDRPVVGIGLEEDLKCLKVSDIVPIGKRFEFKDHFLDERRQPISLKALTFAVFGDKIQEYQDNYDPLKGHDAVKDARYTLQLYQLYIDNKLNQQPSDTEPGLMSYQWCRNSVNDAVKAGKLIDNKKKK
ncbi:uncharacterized protein LOC128954115 [Oppia nitens]|uniref:uncharacterized protein LOC128954115 n=1 Tax=Oppia nitens TaxID=1686743 RepID=UPI0023DC23AE|nr:uncharacterized protein LOC128954115 [Oppia nitens]